MKKVANKGAWIYDTETGTAGKLLMDVTASPKDGAILGAMAVPQPDGSTVIQVITIALQALIYLKDVTSILKDVIILIFGTKEERQQRKALKLALKHEKGLNKISGADQEAVVLYR